MITQMEPGYHMDAVPLGEELPVRPGPPDHGYGHGL